MVDSATKSTKSGPASLRMWRIVLFGSVFLAVLLAVDITFASNIQFYSKWIECGQKPVETKGSGFLNDGASYYYTPSSLPGIHSSIEYFCTPIEAERAGYSANPNNYDYPNLEKA